MIAKSLTLEVCDRCSKPYLQNSTGSTCDNCLHGTQRTRAVVMVPKETYDALVAEVNRARAEKGYPPWSR